MWPWVGCWLVVLRINVDLAIFQPYLNLEAGDNQSLKIQVARPGIEPRSSCSASQELNHSATAAPMWPWAGKVKVKVTSKGHNSVEVIKVNKPTKHQVWTGEHHTFKAIHKQANISVCSLKHEVKVKVTKVCASLEELINIYKLTKFDSCIINGLLETKLNATAKRNCWRWMDRQTVFANS